MFFSLIIGCDRFIRFCTVSTIEKVTGLRFSFPLSTFEMSRMSLISVSRWLLARRIFLRFSAMASLSSGFFSAIVVRPMIAFIGVRMSCDIVDRKSVFALLAASASLAVTCSFWLIACMYRKSITSRSSSPKVMTPIRIQFSVTAFRSVTGAELSSTQPFVDVMGVWATRHSLLLESCIVNDPVPDRISANSCCCSAIPG